MSIKRTVVKKHEAPALTNKAINSAMHRDKDYLLAGEAGLFLRIYARRSDGKPSSKTYYHVWTEKGSTNKNRIKLGSHIENDKHRTKSGQLTLSQAVKRNQEIISLLDQGIDPRKSLTPTVADSITPTTADEDKCWANMTVKVLDFAINELSIATDEAEIGAIMASAVSSLGMNHFVYASCGVDPDGSARIRIVNGYDRVWREKYLEKGYISCDPTLAHCLMQPLVTTRVVVFHQYSRRC